MSVGGVDVQVERVEMENLRAVGLRNKMAAMHEVRLRVAQAATLVWLQSCYVT